MINIPNLGIKILSLVIAIFTWLYIGNEIQVGRIKRIRVAPSIFGYELTEKKVEIKPNIIGQPVDGYRLDSRNIRIDPKYMIVVGPNKYLKDIEYIYTEGIDISEFTRDIRIAVKLSKFTKGYTPTKNLVNVVIPIEKIDDRKGEE